LKLFINKNMNFIKKFWEGNVSMVISFWVFNVLIEQIIIGLLAIIFAFPLMLFMWVPYKIWAVVGVWRSAAKYKGKPIWPGLAKIYIVVTLGFFTLRFGRNIIYSLI
tara:strand:+ start:101 stop:421 length:321 start_codon:yes stop_codon:yes gene_type:complete